MAGIADRKGAEAHRHTLPRVTSTLPSLSEVSPLTRLVSLAGFRGWRFTIREYPGSDASTGVTACGVLKLGASELKSDVVSDPEPRARELRIASDLLRQVQAAGHGIPLSPRVLPLTGRVHLLRLACAALRLPEPSVPSGGETELPRRCISAAVRLGYPGGVLIVQGAEEDTRSAAKRSAAGAFLEHEDSKRLLGAAHSFGATTDSVTHLQSATQAAGLGLPAYRFSYEIPAIPAAIVVRDRSGAEHTFLGHADSLANAREVAALRACRWLFKTYRAELKDFAKADAEKRH